MCCHTQSSCSNLHAHFPANCELLLVLLCCRAMQLFVGGYDVTQLEGQGDELYVHRKALKALHVLFDMEVCTTSRPCSRRPLLLPAMLVGQQQLKPHTPTSCGTTHAVFAVC